MRRLNLGGKLVRSVIIWAMTFMLAFTPAVGSLTTLTVYAAGEEGGPEGGHEDGDHDKGSDKGGDKGGSENKGGSESKSESPKHESSNKTESGSKENSESLSKGNNSENAKKSQESEKSSNSAAQSAEGHANDSKDEASKADGYKDDAEKALGSDGTDGKERSGAKGAAADAEDAADAASVKSGEAETALGSDGTDGKERSGAKGAEADAKDALGAKDKEDSALGQEALTEVERDRLQKLAGSDGTDGKERSGAAGAAADAKDAYTAADQITKEIDAKMAEAFTDTETAKSCVTTINDAQKEADAANKAMAAAEEKTADARTQAEAELKTILENAAESEDGKAPRAVTDAYDKIKGLNEAAQTEVSKAKTLLDGADQKVQDAEKALEQLKKDQSAIEELKKEQEVAIKVAEDAVTAAYANLALAQDAYLSQINNAFATALAELNAAKADTTKTEEEIAALQKKVDDQREQLTISEDRANELAKKALEYSNTADAKATEAENKAKAAEAVRDDQEAWDSYTKKASDACDKASGALDDAKAALGNDGTEEGAVRSGALGAQENAKDAAAASKTNLEAAQKAYEAINGDKEKLRLALELIKLTDDDGLSAEAQAKRDELVSELEKAVEKFDAAADDLQRYDNVTDGFAEEVKKNWDESERETSLLGIKYHDISAFISSFANMLTDRSSIESKYSDSELADTGKLFDVTKIDWEKLAKFDIKGAFEKFYNSSEDNTDKLADYANNLCIEANMDQTLLNVFDTSYQKAIADKYAEKAKQAADAASVFVGGAQTALADALKAKNSVEQFKLTAADYASAARTAATNARDYANQAQTASDNATKAAEDAATAYNAYQDALKALKEAQDKVKALKADTRSITNDQIKAAEDKLEAATRDRNDAKKSYDKAVAELTIAKSCESWLKELAKAGTSEGSKAYVSKFLLYEGKDENDFTRDSKDWFVPGDYNINKDPDLVTGYYRFVATDVTIPYEAMYAYVKIMNQKMPKIWWTYSDKALSGDDQPSGRDLYNAKYRYADYSALRTVKNPNSLYSFGVSAGGPAAVREAAKGNQKSSDDATLPVIYWDVTEVNGKKTLTGNFHVGVDDSMNDGEEYFVAYAMKTGGADGLYHLDGVFVTYEKQKTPVVSETPETPETPVVSETPETPETPVVSETPETPETPEVPVTSETPETPVVSETPETPETPVVSETPETPETPVVSETPETPETPVVSVIPETPETPAENSNEGGSKGEEGGSRKNRSTNRTTSGTNQNPAQNDEDVNRDNLTPLPDGNDLTGGTPGADAGAPAGGAQGGNGQGAGAGAQVAQGGIEIADMGTPGAATFETILDGRTPGAATFEIPDGPAATSDTIPDEESAPVMPFALAGLVAAGASGVYTKKKVFVKK